MLPNKQLRLDPAQLTDVGRKRPHNEDNMAYVIPKDPQAMARKGALFIVADGMGGHAAGEVASEIAVDTVSKVYYQDDSDDAPASLLRAIKRANALIHQRAAENMQRSGMGTTCVAAVLRGNIAYVANVGDSRAYFVRGGVVKQISQDHSWVEEQVRAGLLTREQARSHAQRNVITRCLGTQADVDVDIFSEQLEEGDVLVLCSDGLSGSINDDDIRAVVDQYQPQESVYHLVERANENGGPDNITAIVVRVLEVGNEPPSSMYPLYVGGGREVDEDTLSIGPFPGAPFMPMPGMSSLRTENGRITTSPLRHSSGPLEVHDIVTAPQPVLQPQRGLRPRLFYPTLAVLVLLVVSLVAGSLYYFLFRHPNNVDIAKNLSDARAAIARANTEVSSNPTDALQQLASAKIALLAVQNTSHSTTQDGELKKLQSSFVTLLKSVITNYNVQSQITALPCNNVSPTSINTGATNTQAKSLAMIQDQKGNPVSYALGNDNVLYQLVLQNNQQSLVNPLQALNNSVLSIASDDTRVLALAKGTTFGSYTLHVLIPDNGGTLQDKNTSTINPQFTKDGSVPTFLTAWGTTVYVVLTSPTAAGQNRAVILKYTVTKNNTLNPVTPDVPISISGVTAAAAFPDRLFLLDGQGAVQSLGVGSQTPDTVIVSKPVVLPLAVNPNDVTTSTNVPQVTPQSSTFLRLPGATLLVSGTNVVDKQPHLYVVDSVNHRVLNLKSSGTAVVANTTATPTSATSNNGSTGGGVVGPTPVGQTAMELSQQYTSPSLLSHVTSLVTDPKQAQLHLLTQNAANAALSLFSVDVSQPNACTSS